MSDLEYRKPESEYIKTKYIIHVRKSKQMHYEF